MGQEAGETARSVLDLALFPVLAADEHPLRSIPPVSGSTDHREALFLCRQGGVQPRHGGTRVPAVRSDTVGW